MEKKIFYAKVTYFYVKFRINKMNFYFQINQSEQQQLILQRHMIQAAF